MTLLLYRILGFIIWSLGFLPLRILYIMSDFMYLIVYYIAGYRKKVVFDNLNGAFPDKDKKEIRAIAKKFYRHLCDLVVETIHQQVMDEKEISLRVRYTNPQIVNDYFNRGKDVAAIIGHCGNWEWMCGFPLITRYKCVTIYKPLSNPVFDNFMLKLREKFGADLVPMKMVVRRLVEYRRKKLPTITAFIADQAPRRDNSMVWTEFLGRETAVYTGVGKIAVKMDMAVVYFIMRKVKRGYYEFEFVPLFDSAAATTEIEITKAHISILEKQIAEQPEHWLWSHRRWKLKREEG
jgi:Kdo2-lipid IVA lauroyltransferase/acyltransferase